MYDRNPVDLALLHMLPGRLAARGVPEGRLLARAGLDTEDGHRSGRYVARAQVCALLEDVARLTGEPAIGIELGQAADPRRLGAAGGALLSGATLGDCLETHARAMPRLQAGVTLRVERSGGRARWRHRLADSDPERTRVLSEGIVAFMLAAIRSIVAEPVEAEVAFPHRRRAAAAGYADALRAAVRFAAPDGECVVGFDAGLLDAPNRDRSAGMPVAASPAPPRLPDDDAALARALGRLIAGLAPTGELSLVAAAERLGLPPRSLQRRLAASGLSFGDRVEAWRRDEARRLLDGTGAPVAAVARARLCRPEPLHPGLPPLGGRLSAGLARNGYGGGHGAAVLMPRGRAGPRRAGSGHGADRRHRESRPAPPVRPRPRRDGRRTSSTSSPTTSATPTSASTAPTSRPRPSTAARRRAPRWSSSMPSRSAPRAAPR